LEESTARQVVWLQAFETAQPPSPSWRPEDSAQATRAALQNERMAPSAPGAGPSSAPHTAFNTAEALAGFVTRRAQFAMRRLALREVVAGQALARPTWQARWVVSALLVGWLCGLLIDGVGNGQHINLLAPTLWAVVVWSWGVYALLLGQTVARLNRPELETLKKPHALLRWTQKLLVCSHSLPGWDAASAQAMGSSAAWQAFSELWRACSAPLALVRAQILLHAAAAGLALGLIIGMGLRAGLFAHPVAWRSELVSAGTVQALLQLLLAPAQWLTNTPLPDAASLEALRWSSQGVVPPAAGVGAAAPWVRWFSITLMFWVVLPRAALALWASARAQQLSQQIVLPLGDAYFKNLARQMSGDALRVTVLPCGYSPGPQVAQSLHALLAHALGAQLQLQLGPTQALGTPEEDGAEGPLLDRGMPPPGTTLAVALFDLNHDPEVAYHGRYAQMLAARVPTLLLIDVANFTLRCAEDPQRMAVHMAQRCDAWCALALALNTLAVFANLDEPDLGVAPAQIQQAVRKPVRAA
jgi:Protein of unknown function (DUF2868)